MIELLKKESYIIKEKENVKGGMHFNTFKFSILSFLQKLTNLKEFCSSLSVSPDLSYHASDGQSDRKAISSIRQNPCESKVGRK